LFHNFDFADHLVFLNLIDFLIKQLDLRHIRHITHSFNFKVYLSEIITWLGCDFFFLAAIFELRLWLLLLNDKNLSRLGVFNGLKHFFRCDEYISFFFDFVYCNAGSKVDSCSYDIFVSFFSIFLSVPFISGLFKFFLELLEYFLWVFIFK
jgi:hypothetical protein